MVLLPSLALAQSVAWAPCVGIDTAESAECTTLDVVEDYGNPGEGVGTVLVTVARVPAKAPATRHLWVTAPAPGGSALAELVRWSERDLPDDVELYAVDHRGAGANRLVCPDQEALTSAGGARIESEEIGPCATFLEPQIGGLQFVDATQSGADLMELSERLKEPDTQVFFVGSGYGSFLLQRALVVSGRPEGVILDGLWPDDASVSEYDAGLDAMARRILAHCDYEDDCADALSHPADELIEDFLDDPAACEAFVDADDARALLAALAAGTPELQSLLPAVLDRMVRCHHDDMEALRHLDQALDEANEHPGASAVLELHLAFGELWRTAAPADGGHLASSGTSVRLDQGESDWRLPFGPSSPRYPDHERPVLLLHPELAPLTDPSVGEHYPWDEHHEVTVDGAFGAVTETDCGQQLLLDFLDDPSALPASCDAALDFLGDPESDQRWLGVDDRFERSGCGCVGAPSSGAGLLPPLLALVSRRRARPGTRSPR